MTTKTRKKRSVAPRVPPSPWRKASAAPADSGKSRSKRGVISSDIRPERKIAPRKVITARKASVPARAASAVAVMPVISSATIKGTIVILSALSQSRPIGSIHGSDAVPASGDTSSTPIPSSMPAISAERMNQADFKTDSPGDFSGQLAKQIWVT